MMKLQNFQKKDQKVIQKFLEWRKNHPNPERCLNLSWSNWGFGIEPVCDESTTISHSNKRRGQPRRDEISLDASTTNF